MIEIPPRSASARGQSDPLFYVNSNMQSPTALTSNDAENVPTQSTSPQQEASSTTYSRVTSELANLTLTLEISLKSLEYAILCTEYGEWFSVASLFIFLHRIASWKSDYPLVQCNIDALLMFAPFNHFPNNPDLTGMLKGWDYDMTIAIHVADPSQNVNVHLDQVFRKIVVRLMNWLIGFFFSQKLS